MLTDNDLMKVTYKLDTGRIKTLHLTEENWKS